MNGHRVKVKHLSRTRQIDEREVFTVDNYDFTWIDKGVRLGGKDYISVSGTVIFRFC